MVAILARAGLVPVATVMGAVAVIAGTAVAATVVTLLAMAALRPAAIAVLGILRGRLVIGPPAGAPVG